MPEGVAGAAVRLTWTGVWQGGVAGAVLGVATFLATSLPDTLTSYREGHVVGGGLYAPTGAQLVWDVMLFSVFVAVTGVLVGAATGLLLGSVAGAAFGVGLSVAGRDVGAFLAVLVPGVLLVAWTVMLFATAGGLVVILVVLVGVAVPPLAFAVRREHARIGGATT